MSSIILSSYFTKKAHPNHPQDTSVVGRMPNMHVKNNSFTYIKDWYLSIEKNNLNAVLFHDDLSNDFVDKYQTSKIKFQKVKDSIWVYLGR